MPFSDEQILKLRELATVTIESTRANKNERVDPMTCGCSVCQFARGMLALLDEREKARERVAYLERILNADEMYLRCRDCGAYEGVDDADDWSTTEDGDHLCEGCNEKCEPAEEA